MTTQLSSHLTALRKVFAQVKDKHRAHQQAAPILQDMAATPATFTAILQNHFKTDAALSRQHYPVVSLDIETNKYFGLVANCWIPLPDADTDMSTKAIHHHGSMLLTTVTAFGPGYVHWMFSAPQAVDRESDLYAMRLLERTPHPMGHAAFVDANIGHVPFFPPSLTITLALWSSREPASWKDSLKRVPALHKHSMALRELASSLGLARMLDLNIATYFDFFPDASGFRGMKEREEFSRGPTEDYLYSLFHIVQKTGNESLVPDIRARANANPLPAQAKLVSRLLSDLQSGRPIEGRLSAGHYGVPFANFRAMAIERALEACGR
jgi:hypothetical protein